MKNRSKSKDKSDGKRLSRFHQMEQMEAAARGTAPSMTLDTSSFLPTATTSTATTSSGHSQQVAADFLQQDFDKASTLVDRNEATESVSSKGPLGSSSSVRGPMSTGNFFSQMDKYEVDQTVNLMDTSIKDYEMKPSHHSKRASFVDIFLGGGGRSSGSGSGHSRGNARTTWSASVMGRLLIGCFIVAFICLMALSVPLLMTDDGNNVPEKEKAQLNVKDAIHEAIQDNKELDDRFYILKEALANEKISNAGGLDEDSKGASAHALRWLAKDDPAQLQADDPNLMSRFALATFYFAMHAETTASASTERQVMNGDRDDGTATTDSNGWKKEDGWLTGSSVCDWHGVRCVDDDNEKHQVMALNLTDNGLRGMLPAEISLLTSFLSIIELSNNQISGSIPESFSDMTALKALYLTRNALTGSVPDFSGLKFITHLHLGRNSLDGPLPSTINELPDINDLQLQNNRFTGTISRDMSQMKNLRRLYLGNNKIVGSIPDMFEGLTSLTDLQFHGNRLRSQLPASMGYLSNLRRLTLEGNVMSGSLPPSWGGMTDLEALEIFHNDLVGPIPTEFGLMSSLKNLGLEHNFLQGDIPSELGNLKKLETLQLQHNVFRAKIPEELGNLKELEKMDVSENIVTGTVPDEICQLTNHGNLKDLVADCKEEIMCSCCSKCL